jgi:transposase-like protein
MSKVKINSKIIKSAVEEYAKSDISIRDIARKYNISYETVRQGILSLSPESMKKKGKVATSASVPTTVPKAAPIQPNYGSLKMHKKLAKIASKYKVTISVVINDNVVVIK